MKTEPPIGMRHLGEEGGRIHDNHGMLCFDGNTCVGDIVEFEGKFFDPNGRIEGVTKEQAETHNRLLDEGRILGLDSNCDVGMSGLFYFTDGRVTTWRGTQVSERVSVAGASLRFWRNGMEFVGRRRKDDDSVVFKRVK